MHTRHRRSAFVAKADNSPMPQPAVTLATFVTEAGNPGAQLATSAPVATQ